MKNGSKNDDDFFFQKKMKLKKTIYQMKKKIENGNEQDFQKKDIWNKTSFEEQHADEEKKIKSFPLSKEEISETKNGFKETFGKE